MEQWKAVVKAPNYEISNEGRVRNISTGKFLKSSVDRYGYLKIALNLGKRGFRYYCTIHRLVAEAWIPNQENKPVVNHRDGNKLNNRVSNLEWNTVKENSVHAVENQLTNNVCPVVMYDLDTKKKYRVRSLKQLGKYFLMNLASLVPFIKRSKDYPLFNRYIVEIIDKSELINSNNIINFGIEVHVYDHLIDKFFIYPSATVAAYETGIRGIHRVNSRGKFETIGYVLSLVSFETPPYRENKEVIREEREKYLSVPYRQQDKTIYLYDYYLRKEYFFEDRNQAITFINSENLADPVTIEEIINKLGRVSQYKETRLLRGFGIRSGKHEYPWCPYSEEMILLSQRHIAGQQAVWRVIEKNSEVLIFGLDEMCDYLGISRASNFYKIKELIESNNIPNLNIVRLDKPII